MRKGERDRQSDGERIGGARERKCGGGEKE